MDSSKPKFIPFKKTRVVLALLELPLPSEQTGDLTKTIQGVFRSADPGLQGDESDSGPSGPSGPSMFNKKRKPRDQKKQQAQQGQEATTGFIGLSTRQGKSKKKTVPGEILPYKEEQKAALDKLQEDSNLQGRAKGFIDIESTDPYTIEGNDIFTPVSRSSFGSFLVDNFGPIFPKVGQGALDVPKCAAKGEEGTKEVKIYHYQAFIREYLRYESPYRGLLVYHGLGSGKTCSAIAAAEALFGTRGVKIVVMTPFSLHDNFISEVNFCGFKHFRLQNHWIPLSLVAGSKPDPALVRMFAQNILKIPDSYFASGPKKSKVQRIWIPDFTEAPNFDSLSAVERDEIKTQLKLTIENRIYFINYNGITADELKTVVCSTPEIFDNAVIVVDEIHNVIRLIQGCLEPYFSKSPARKKSLPLEVLTPERKKLPLCGMSKKYMRGYLFYRLFMDAKNSKIIGLSGTPLINFPEELGILANILHGPIYKINFSVKAEGSREVKPLIEEIIKNNEDLDTLHFSLSQGIVNVTLTRLPEQFIKIFNKETNEILGIQRRDPGKQIPTLEQVWLKVKVELISKKIQVVGENTRTAQELLPSWDTPFRGAFLEEDGIRLKNEIVLQKRIRGLISYYRGIQGNVMPKIKIDKIVGVPLTGHSLRVYNNLRTQEIQIEMKKPKKQGAAGDAVWAEINDIATMKSASNYRMSSRQACNFAFPEGITRPRPNNLEEQDAETGTDRDVIIDTDLEGKVAGKDEEEKEAEDDDQTKEEVLQEIGKQEKPVERGTKEAKAAYQAALKSTKQKLRSMRETHLRLDGPPENNLAKYSPKFAAMIETINRIEGSSLVYSNFLEMEGIGIFAICMEANGYEPIEITADLNFTEKTKASLQKGPGVPQKRYIEFTGAGKKGQRAAAVDLFNARLDKLPPALQKVLQDAGWKNNFDGGLCRVFCITSAGAEGLSLKCVRGVHIMEPYWNTVRTQQVKGRAVRICSHMDLPEEEQNVEIYTYCSMIPDEAVKAQAVTKSIENNDEYYAKEATELGVPVPQEVAEGNLPEGMFIKVNVGQEKVAENSGPENPDLPIEFSNKTDNKFYGFASFAKSPVNVNGKVYPTLEHYFQAMKFPSEPAWQETIRVAQTPQMARLLGSQKDHTMDPDWDNNKEKVILTGLRAKFQQNSGLLETLKSTGKRPLIESSVDTYWGKGPTGKGKNRYGKILEQVREELREYVIKGVEESAAAPPLALAPAPAAPAAPAALAAPPAPAGSSEENEDRETEEFMDEMHGKFEENQAKITQKALALPGERERVIAEAARLKKEQDERLKVPPSSSSAEGEQGGGGPDDNRKIILSSDQKVLLISLRKEKVISSLQNLMKSAAVDCELNFEENNDGTFRCFALNNSIGSFAYHPDLQQDIEETRGRYMLKKGNGMQGGAMHAGAMQGGAKRTLKHASKHYNYKIMKDSNKKLRGYLLHNIEDQKYKTPIGFLDADPSNHFLPHGPMKDIPGDLDLN